MKGAKMKRIYICSPYSGNITTNTHIASLASRVVALSGDMPITPHLYFPQFLNDNNARERALGFEFNYKLMQDCDLMYVIGEPTTGMQQELTIAYKLDLNIYRFSSFEELMKFCGKEKK